MSSAVVQSPGKDVASKIYSMTLSRSWTATQLGFPMTDERVFQICTRLYRVLERYPGIIRAITADDKEQITDELLAKLTACLTEGAKGLSPGEREKIKELIRQTLPSQQTRVLVGEYLDKTAERSEMNYRKNRDPQKRNVERDRRIFELREKGLTFKEISRVLKEENPEWTRDEGKQLSVASVRQAHYREKLNRQMKLLSFSVVCREITEADEKTAPDSGQSHCKPPNFSWPP
jgi:hypothetical protein